MRDRSHSYILHTQIAIQLKGVRRQFELRYEIIFTVYLAACFFLIAETTKNLIRKY